MQVHQRFATLLFGLKKGCTFHLHLHQRKSLLRSFSSSIQQPVPVYSTCKSWSRLLKLRYSMKSWNRETLRNFHHIRVQRVKEACHRLWAHGLAAVAGLGVGTLLLSNSNVVECKVKHRDKNRLVGHQEGEGERKADVDFDWKQFFNLLWPDIYSLALAIVDKNRLVGHWEEDGERKADVDFDWKQFLNLLWSDIYSLALAIACALATAVVNIKLPLMVGEVVNVISEFAKDTTRNFMDDIKKPALRLIATYLIQGGLTVAYISLLSNIGENLAARLRTSLFSSLLRQDIEFFDRHKTGELIDRLTSDVQDFKSSFKLCVSQGLRAVTQTIGCIAALWIISPKLTMVMCVVIPVIIGGGSLMGSGLRKMSRAAQEQVSKSTAVANEAVGNVRTVRAFAMEPKENELFAGEVEKARKLNLKLGIGIGLFQGLANIALNGIVLGTLCVGGMFMSRHEITPGDLMSFLVATQTVERSLAQMSVLFGQVVRGLSAGGRVFEYINYDPSIPLTGGKTIPYHSMMGNVEFSDVTFNYPTRHEQDVLKHFSLKIPAGKTVALVGASGGGKSTVASLLERFYDVKHGSIMIDNVNIQHLDPSWLRGHAIGFINQEPVLFATSVMENIRYGCPEATDQEVFEAAKKANAHDFITKFPRGYNTVLGERGVTVSGGQKQRIAIARALIKNPSIMVLDEATSALDAESERIVQEALDKVCKGRTVLVIAHRLSTIRDADIIAVVAGGKIVEMGNHNSLKKTRGLYWELIQQQAIEEEIEHFKL